MILRLAVFLGILLMISLPAYAGAWYEGGTLQKATVADWIQATPDNQLATAADFSASLSGVADISTIHDPAALDELRKKSQDLQTCISQSVQDPAVPPDRPLAQIVVLCTILKQK